MNFLPSKDAIALKNKNKDINVLFAARKYKEARILHEDLVRVAEAIGVCPSCLRPHLGTLKDRGWKYGVECMYCS